MSERRESLDRKLAEAKARRGLKLAEEADRRTGGDGDVARNLRTISQLFSSPVVRVDRLGDDTFALQFETGPDVMLSVDSLVEWRRFERACIRCRQEIPETALSREGFRRVVTAILAAAVPVYSFTELEVTRTWLRHSNIDFDIDAAKLSPGERAMLYRGFKGGSDLEKFEAAGWVEGPTLIVRLARLLNYVRGSGERVTQPELALRLNRVGLLPEIRTYSPGAPAKRVRARVWSGRLRTVMGDDDCDDGEAGEP